MSSEREKILNDLGDQSKIIRYNVCCVLAAGLKPSIPGGDEEDASRVPGET